MLAIKKKVKNHASVIKTAFILSNRNVLKIFKNIGQFFSQ